MSAYYDALFRDLVERLGTLSPITMTAIAGFGVGGPVSMIQVREQHAFVTCELSRYPEQVPSSEGERYELLCRMPLSEDQIQALLTAVGALSMEAELGDGHTVDISAIGVAPSLNVVQLSHFSSSVIDGAPCGIYEVTELP
jgi:hypothetical protein